MSAKGVDLGMLEALIVLVEEQHVSRAAQRLAVSQSALSYTLGRLREVLDDPVLVRTGSGMVATDRAVELTHTLAEPILTINEELRRGGSFDPARAAPHFRIGASGFATAIIMPRLMQVLRAASPQCTVEVFPTTRIATSNQLEMGKIDLALGYFPDLPDSLVTKTLGQEELCLIAAAGSAHADHITVDMIREIGFFGYTTGEGQLVNYEVAFDDALKLHDVHRRIVFRCSSMQVIPNMLANANLIANVPRRAAEILSKNQPLRRLECGIELPRIPVQAIWHQRTHRDEAQLWMRRCLEQVTRDMS